MHVSTSFKTIGIFVSYAQEDIFLQQELCKQPGILQHQSFIDLWYDRDIKAGMEREKEINAHFNAAQIILLLVSADFLASDYCYGVEVRGSASSNSSALAVPGEAYAVVARLK